MTRFKIRGGKLLLVRGTYEAEDVLRAMNVQQAIQWASQLLEAIDRLAVQLQVTVIVDDTDPTMRDGGRLQLHLLCDHERDRAEGEALCAACRRVSGAV